MTAPVVVPAKIYTPENLTFEDVKGWSGPEMRRQMATPLRPHIISIISSRPLAEVEAVAAAQPVEEAVPDAVVAPVADNSTLLAEAQRLVAEAEARRVAAPVVAPVEPKKIVVDYQITDEEGNPLGRPTHLEATTAEEMVAKQKEAHIQATRAFHRLKKQKLTFKAADPVIPAVDDVSDAEILAAIRDMKSDDPKTALAAVKRINSAEAARIKAQADAEVEKVNELRRQEQVTFRFLKAHSDYNNCDANNTLIGEYFKEHDLAWNTDNLELAFNALESELAPVVKPVAPAAAVVNPPPVAAPVPTTVAAQPVVQPVVTVPAPTPAVVNPPALDPRPGVNGGLMPGQQSAVRPAAKTTGLTAEEVRSWDGPTMRLKMKNPNLRAQILKFVADHNAKKLLQTA